MRTNELLLIGVTALAQLAGACRSRAVASMEAGPMERETTSAALDAGRDAGAAMSPLRGEWMERLELASGRVVYVAPPLGSTEPRPLLVAVHGAMDDPGLMCSAWRLIADVYPFVVCPGGSRVKKDTYVWPSSAAIDQAVDEAIAAVRAKYGDRVSAGPAVYAAFSQGANMAGPVLGATKPGRFGRAVLTEGGYRAFETREAAAAFAKAGGERVLFTCSQSGCASWFEGSRAQLARSAVARGRRAEDAVRVTYAGPYGHALPPAVRQAINEELPWVVEGLAGWETYATAPKLATH